MTFPVSFRTWRSMLAMTLTLWCAGAGCLLVSYAHGATMSSVAGAEEQNAKTNSLPAPAVMDSHACCKARPSAKHQAPSPRQAQAETAPAPLRVEAGLPATPAPSGDAMSCCPLTSGSLAVPSRSQSNDEQDRTAAAGNKQAPIHNHTRPASPARPLRLPNQNQTYLRCCVFLI